MPSNTGNDEPHPELTGDAPMLQVLAEGQLWPADCPLRASVSAMGFGGINTHVVLEATSSSRRRKTLDERAQRLLVSSQDAELFMLGGSDIAALREQVEHLLTFAFRLSLAELTDLAAQLQRTLEQSSVRAALVASTPAELANRLETLRAWLMEGVNNARSERLDLRAGLFLGSGVTAPRIGYLFPGQGTKVYLDGGALRRRFSCVAELYAQIDLSSYGYQGVETIVAQPAVVTASLASLRVFRQFGLNASVAVGHSLGELTALHWAGAMDEAALLRVAVMRGKAMMDLGNPTGTMATIGAGKEVVRDLLDGASGGTPVSIACLNTPRRTVISGETADVAGVVARAQARGLEARHIPVSHAFHSPLVAAAAQPLAAYLSHETFQPLQQTVISTVTGARLAVDADLSVLLHRQVTEPVRFVEAVSKAAQDVDLFLEVGPGRALSGLAGEFVDAPIVALDVGGPSLKGLLHAVGAAYALGAPVNHAALFADRFSRPFDLHWQARFLVNPCELAPIPEKSAWGPEGSLGSLPGHNNGVETDGSPLGAERNLASEPSAPAIMTVSKPEKRDILGLVRQLIAARVELPLSAVSEHDRLLSDLHLNSITVTQIVAETARQLGIPAPVAPTEFANLTVVDVAQTIEEIARNGSAAAAEEQTAPSGVDAWVRAFDVTWLERPWSPDGSPLGPKRPGEAVVPGAWQVITPPDYPLAGALQQALAQAEGNGVVVCLPPEPDEHHVGLLLQGGSCT